MYYVSCRQIRSESSAISQTSGGTFFLAARTPGTVVAHWFAKDARFVEPDTSRFSSGSSRAPSPMEKALPRRKHNFVREQTDDDDDEHDADNLVHGI